MAQNGAIANTWVTSLHETASALQRASGSPGGTRGPERTVEDPPQVPLPPLPAPFTQPPAYEPPNAEVMRLRASRATGGGSGDGGGAKKRLWYASNAFIHVMCIVGVFVLSFILLVAIRPSFTMSKPKDKLHAPKFSVGKAALFAFIATLVAGVIMIVLAVMKARKSKT